MKTNQVLKQSSEEDNRHSFFVLAQMKDMCMVVREKTRFAYLVGKKIHANLKGEMRTLTFVGT